MADDIVKRLRDVVCWCNEFDGVCDACQAADEIKRLRRWKAEATAVLNRWDSLCGRTLEVVRIGDRKSDAMATYIESQKAEIERLRAIVTTVDDLHSPRLAHDTCLGCDHNWPCPTHLLIHPEEVRHD